MNLFLKVTAVIHLKLNEIRKWYQIHIEPNLEPNTEWEQIKISLKDSELKHLEKVCLSYIYI